MKNKIKNIEIESHIFKDKNMADLIINGVCYIKVWGVQKTRFRFLSKKIEEVTRFDFTEKYQEVEIGDYIIREITPENVVCIYVISKTIFELFFDPL